MSHRIVIALDVPEGDYSEADIKRALEARLSAFYPGTGETVPSIVAIITYSR